MELLKKHLPVNMGTDLDLRMEMNDIKHSSVRVKIDLKSTAGYKRSKIASQLKSLTKSTKNVEKKTIVFTTFAPLVFEAFRFSLGISNESYINVRSLKYHINIKDMLLHPYRVNLFSQFKAH